MELITKIISGIRHRDKVQHKMGRLVVFRPVLDPGELLLVE